MRSTRVRVLTGLCAVAVAAWSPGCGSPTMPSLLPAPGTVGILVGAGDIAACDSAGAFETAMLLDTMPGTVFTAGDNAYPAGTRADFRQCYEPTWGRHRARTRPTPGNHDYESARGAPYYEYFGEAAGPTGLGYYHYNVGPWLVIALNSNIDAGPNSAQVAWLRAVLQGQSTRCVAAIWHHPIVSSGPNGGSPQMLEVWRVLLEAGADVVINGHEHLYERYAHLDARGQPAVQGMRLFVVGTGGVGLSQVVSPRPGSLVSIVSWGVLKLTLRPDSYEWSFQPVPGQAAAHDEGRDVCS